MELKEFTQLYNRIQMDPSILLLGQNYLFMGGEEDIAWKRLAEESFGKLELSRKKADYPSLWERAVRNSADADRVMNKIAEAGKGIWHNPAVMAVTKLRWSLLYTSAIDDTEVMMTVRGCSFVPQDEKNANLRYLNKDRRYCVKLCGCRESAPPVRTDKAAWKMFDHTISTKIAWISNAYLEYYGVLVIDGVDMECDWLTDDNLFGQLCGLPPKTIYWFHAPKELGENASLLVQQGSLVTEEKGFYELLLRHMPELFETGEEELSAEEDPTLYTPLTLQFGDKRMRTVWISRSEISDITGDSLCVIDDDIIRGNVPSANSRARRFADFLTQSGLPSWNLFSARPGEISFYIPRDQERELEERVYHALKDSGISRKPILLYGPSNSGKSMMLAHLALTIAKRRKYPIIYMRGELAADAEKRLDDFINNWFCNIDRFGGQRVERIIVIWDGGGLNRTERDYESLQNLLFNRNVQVVGSAYIADNLPGIRLRQDLSEIEEKRLRKVLGSLGADYVERFDEVLKTRKNVKTLENKSLLYLLQALFKYEFNAEYKKLASILSMQFTHEKHFAETSMEEGLKQYVETFFETQKKILEDGFASSFQEKLRLISAQLALQRAEAKGGEEKDCLDEKEKKHLKYQGLRDQIQEMNNILAVASEFGVRLPLRLLLHILRKRKGNAYATYGEETAKIIEILKKDTLLEYSYLSSDSTGEEYFFEFRNSIEAENYICLLCELPLEDHSDTRKKKEVELLMRIIQIAESEMELRSVIELVRQFGPNGHGRLSELEHMKKSKNYLEYKNFWIQIADALFDRFPEEPEAILLYAHLTREYFNQDSEHEHYYTEVYKKSRIRLESVLQSLKDNGLDDRSQYDRLSIELCANYQQYMRDNGFDEVIYQNIKARVHKVFRKSRRQEGRDIRRDFSSNYMLDILLNAYQVYSTDMAAQGKQDLTEDELAGIIEDIDVMLNLDDLAYEVQAPDLIRKIKRVYNQLGNHTSQITSLEKKFADRNSDMLLYLRARMMWQSSDCREKSPETRDRKMELLYEDHYMVICRDIPYSSLDIPEELCRETVQDAAEVIAFLEDNIAVIQKTRSERCIMMLIRAKWFLKTETPMLAEKQRAALSRKEWDEFNRLCDCYHSYHENSSQENFIPAYFLKGVYEWIYNDPRKAIEWFGRAKDSVRGDSQTKSIERLVLCMEGSDIPRTFLVSVMRHEGGKYTAGILQETTQGALCKDRVSTRYGLGVSDVVVKYLFDGTFPKEERQRAKKDGVVRFNLIGPQIGIPQTGRDM